MQMPYLSYPRLRGYSIYNLFRHLLRGGFLLAACLFIYAPLSAQSDKVTISLNDTTLEAIIDEIRNQTDIDFVYNHEELDKSPRVSVSVSGEKAEEVLAYCLKNSGLRYELVNNTIIISPVKEEAGQDAPKPRVRTQTLRGKVLDRESGFSLPYASVVVLNTNPQRGATTDNFGNFTIENLPVGRYTIKVSYVGYEEAVLSEILVGSAKEVVISVMITEKTESIGEVSISLKKGEPLNQMAAVSARSFSVEETKRYAASISDPARMAQVFAGVAGNDDATNEIVIRGNSPNWMLWRLEGVEIPSPNHFSEEGYTSGAVSILSSDMLGMSDFYTGAFPAEFGSALSGVFDLRLREGNSAHQEYSAQIGILGIDLSAEGPFKKGYGGSYLVNYRYSTLSVLNHLNVKVSNNTLPNYQDLSYKIHLPTKKAGTFSFWGIGGLADDDEKLLPDTAAGQYYEQGYRDFTKTGMYAMGLSHTIFPDEKSYIKTVLSHSMSYSSETYDRMDSLGYLYPNFNDDLRNRALRVNTFYNRKISSRLTLRTGLTLNSLNYNFFTQQADSARSLVTFVNSAGRTNLFQGYLQTKYKFSDKLIFTAGLHYAHFALSRDNSLEPRLGLVVKLPKRQTLSFGFGRHSKNENLPLYFVENENPDGTVAYPNLSLKMSRSTHYIAGYEKMLGNDLSIKTEVYYQRITNLPVPENPDKNWSPIFGGFFPNDTLANIGEGRNYGVELTIQKFFTNNYYILITNSLFDSKFKPASGEWLNTKYNIQFINNFVGGKEFNWGENRMFGINAKIIWTGGKRFVPIDLDASIEEGEGVFITDELFSASAKDYFRIDLGLKLHFFKDNSEHIISLDIQNLTNRSNTLAQEYNPYTKQIEDYLMAGFIPILNYRIEF